MEMIETALSIALKAHAGQKDLDGNPVILHAINVGLSGKTEDEMVAGFLHDVVEDSNYTFEDLRRIGISDKVIEALKLLTHRDGVPYLEYVQDILNSKNAIAINVKTNDLMHNLQRGRAGGHTRLVEKHEGALELIVHDKLKHLY